ncbi:MAG: M28 family metallopeptidase [Bryobacteraceae bacterium]
MRLRFAALLLAAWPLAAMPVDDLSVAQYTTYLNGLYTHTGQSRAPGALNHGYAQTDVYDAFQRFGLTTSLDPFTYNSSTYNNVVGLLPGLVHPDRYYVLGAHYDSVANSPGADDNGSGVAGVMEAARVLSRYRFDASLLFIAFDVEEAGLRGSWAYANRQHALGTDIRGMVSLDMIAYNYGSANRASVACTSSNALRSTLITALSTYSGITANATTSSASDHYPFEANGYQACLMIEDLSHFNPYYHSGLDSVDTAGLIDYNFATNMTRAAVGYLSDSAMLVPEPALTVLTIAAALWIIRRRRSAGA